MVSGPVDAAPVDVAIIGAGPVGLYQVFALGLLELKAAVIDTLPHPGGQCERLYPDKPIYDIPGLPRIHARSLVAQLAEQAAPFRAAMHPDTLVTGLEEVPDGWRLALRSTRAVPHESTLDARAVVVAAGAGAFLPRTLAFEGAEALAGTALHHDAPENRDDLDGRDVIVAGDGPEAVASATALARAVAGDAEAGARSRPRSVALMHRRDALRVDESWRREVDALRSAGHLAFLAAQPEGVERAEASGDGSTRTLRLRMADGALQPRCFDHLFIRLGFSPRLGPIAGWGLALERKLLAVDPATMQTSRSGIHAVGDIVDYPGKRKLLVSGFHEATMAAWALAGRLLPGGAPPLQYTTTSTRLHALLGIAGPHGTAEPAAPVG